MKAKKNSSRKVAAASTSWGGIGTRILIKDPYGRKFETKCDIFEISREIFDKRQGEVLFGNCSLKRTFVQIHSE